MTRRFDLLVFDWDGTLFDSAAIIVHALQSACRDIGSAVPADETARFVIGLGLNEALSHLVPGIDEAGRTMLRERYRHHYASHDAELDLFPGVRPLLAELEARGFLLAVATGKSRAGLARALRAAGLDRTFVATRCADEGFPKPHPDMLLHLIDRTGTTADATLMIGDTTHDLELAQNAGARGLAVTYGAHDGARLAAAQPLGMVASVDELKVWLAQNA